MAIFRVDDYAGASENDKLAACLLEANAASTSETHSVLFSANDGEFPPPIRLTMGTHTLNGNLVLGVEGNTVFDETPTAGNLFGTGRGVRGQTIRFWPSANGDWGLQFKGNYGGGIQNFRFEYDSGTQYNNLTALYLEDCSSFRAENLDFDGANQATDNHIAIALRRVAADNESVTLQGINIRKMGTGIYLHNGDNIVIRDFDISTDGTVSGNNSFGSIAKKAAIHGGDGAGVDFWTIGPGSAQNCEHAFYCNTDRSAAGGSLILQSVRAEQLVMNATSDNACWHMDAKWNGGYTSHGIESVHMTCCRNSPTPLNYGYHFRGLLREPDVSTSSGLFGGPTPDSMVVKSQIVQGGALWAADDTERDAYFTAGVYAGQSITVFDKGVYTILQDYVGDFASSVEGTDWNFQAQVTVTDPDAPGAVDGVPVVDELSHKPIVIGDDYKAINSQAFVWNVEGLPGETSTACTCRFSAFRTVTSPTTPLFEVIGTCADGVDTLWSCVAELDKTDTNTANAGPFTWSLELIDKAGNEVTRAGGQVALVYKGNIR